MILLGNEDPWTGLGLSPYKNLSSLAHESAQICKKYTPIPNTYLILNKTALITCPRSSPNLTTEAKVTVWQKNLNYQKPNCIPELMIPFLMFMIQNRRDPNSDVSSTAGAIISDCWSFFEDLTVSISSKSDSIYINVIPIVLTIWGNWTP